MSTTAADLVRCYAMLLDRTGGLPPDQANIIMANLAASTPQVSTGTPSGSGIPDGLFARPVAVKQGLDVLLGTDKQVHLTPG